MDSHDVENYFRQHRKTLAVVFLMIGMLAVSGFFMGMRQTEYQGTRNPLPAAEKTTVSTAHIPTAPKYQEIAQAEWLANRDWKFTLADLPRAVAPPAARRPSGRYSRGNRRRHRPPEITARLRRGTARHSPRHRYAQVLCLHFLPRRGRQACHRRQTPCRDQPSVDHQLHLLPRPGRRLAAVHRTRR